MFKKYSFPILNQPDFFSDQRVIVILGDWSLSQSRPPGDIALAAQNLLQSFRKYFFLYNTHFPAENHYKRMQELGIRVE